MTKRRKASVIASNDRVMFLGKRDVVVITGTTGASVPIGTIMVDGATAGVATGNVYIAVDTSGTGTKINA